MKISRDNVKVRCDVGRCINPSDYVIDIDGMKRHNIHICASCLNEIYKTIGVVITPKSVENVVKKAENRRYEWKRK